MTTRCPMRALSNCYFAAALVTLLTCWWSAAYVSCSADLMDRILNREPNKHLYTLGTMSDVEGSLARTFMSPSHKKAAVQIKEWIEDAGMESWIDAVGNVHGQLNGSDPNLPMVIIGSHYDTVLDAGRYDGPLGIIVGIAAIKWAVVTELQGQGKLPDNWDGSGVRNEVASGLVLKRTLRLVAFSDEEGVRFQSTFLGSRALAGTLIHYGMLNSKDKSGLSLAEVLQQEGGVSEESLQQGIAAVAVAAQQVAEYIEVHMEQGPVLERKAVSLGVVSAIAGQTRMWLSINGTQGHAGTVPMRGRADSLAAAASAIALVERRCGGGPESDVSEAEGVMEFSEADMLVCTVGELRVWPGASNVIPGNTQLSIDIRSKSDTLRAAVVANVTASIESMCSARGVSCEIKRTHDAAAVLCADDIVLGLANAIQESQDIIMTIAAKESSKHGSGSGSGSDSCSSVESSTQDSAELGTCSSGGSTRSLDSMGSTADVPIMVSGAGHDAMAMAEITKMGMMFVRCRGGISHSPLEHVEPMDVAAAAAALYKYIVREKA